MEVVSVKLSNGNTHRRFKIKGNGIDALFANLMENLSQVSETDGDFDVAWQDEDGDSVVITRAIELGEALEDRKDNVLRLHTIKKSTEKTEIKEEKKDVNASESNADKPPANSNMSQTAVHKNVLCDLCDREVVGTRYRCLLRVDHDLCQDCEKTATMDHSNDDAKGKCPACGADFARWKDIYHHPSAEHSWTKDRAEDLKVDNRNKRLLSSNDSGDVLQSECALLSTTKRGLTKHQKDQKDKDHGSNHGSCPKISCPLCEAPIQDHMALVHHVGLYHTDSPEDYVMQEETFSSWKDFEVWKTDLEKKTGARFFASNTKTTRSGKVMYFKCSRAKARPSHKATVTKKVVPYCTAHMMVKEHGQNIFVRFCKAHSGHEVDEEVPIGTEVQVVTYESTDTCQPLEEDDGRVGSVHDMDGPSTREMMAAAETKLSVLKLQLFAPSKGSSREDREDMEKVTALIDNAISVASDAVKKRRAKQQEALATSIRTGSGWSSA